jgi:hypothetical protein
MAKREGQIGAVWDQAHHWCRGRCATSDLVLGMVPRGHTEAHMAKSEPGGRILSAGREEAARERIWGANRALVERLLSIMNQEDNPELSAIDNQRRRYARILWGMAAYFRAIGHDKLPELGTHIASLGVALEGLIRGVTDPLFVTKGSKRDSMRTWGARLQAALGLECWIKSDLSRETAASDAARNYKALARLKRGTNRDLKGSLLSLVRRLRRGAGPSARTAGGLSRNASRNQGGQSLAGGIPKNRRAILRAGRQIGNPLSFKQIPTFV